MRTVASPQISPDGTRVVYEETRTDWDANAFATDLWIANPALGNRTSSPRKRSPRATPPGRPTAAR
jgi:dipeptidyl aminopeptidase/acylaminoacyl peptidase